MMRFLRALMGGVARGLWWTATQAIDLVGGVGRSLWTAVWRHWCPPPLAEAESTADNIKRTVDGLAARRATIEAEVEHERPAPNPASPAQVRRSMEAALAYTTAILEGERLPSLERVAPALCHELRQLKTKAQALPMHRDLQDALGHIGDRVTWDAPLVEREVLAPALDHDDPPTLRYA